MLTRRRKRPFNQGYIKQIYELFFKPIVTSYKPSDQSLYDFLEELFDVKHRYITRYRVKSDFKIKGLFYVAGWAKTQGLGNRDVPAGSIIWVREDMREPEHVDIEVVRQGREDEVYYLTKLEWEEHKLNCLNLDFDNDQ